MVEILNEKAAMPELHPAITHINASPEFLSKQENVNVLNKMVELAYNHGAPESFFLLEKQVDEIFLEGMNAQKLIGELPTPRVRLRLLKKKLKTKA